MDVSDQCVTANFNFGIEDTTSKRKYNIRVLQYICGDEMAGPPDCLQYFTSTSGTVASFNFPTDQATVGSTSKMLNHTKLVHF